MKTPEYIEAPFKARRVSNKALERLNNDVRGMSSFKLLHVLYERHEATLWIGAFWLTWAWIVWNKLGM